MTKRLNDNVLSASSHEIIRKYLFLRDEIDNICLKLENLHKDFIVCTEGCTGCCMDFSILPVEFYSLLKDLEGRKKVINKPVSPDECIFLADASCSVYESRPVICRTHGLPLMFMGEEEWELSWCELNFRDYTTGFNEANTFPQDRFNSKLFMLNKEFIGSLKENQYSEFDLIPLKEAFNERYGSV
jgi:Fe-S-cluster containining protein